MAKILRQQWRADCEEIYREARRENAKCDQHPGRQSGSGPERRPALTFSVETQFGDDGTIWPLVAMTALRRDRRGSRAGSSALRPCAAIPPPAPTRPALHRRCCGPCRPTGRAGSGSPRSENRDRGHWR
jgi:hypothetical protein